MNLKCGIIGLPNVGKSTLFNALTASNNAVAANYPFCTIEPNEDIASVPDPRLDILADMAGSAKVIPAYIRFVDIAGLVKGASKGEGLGNKFLSHIREVDMIIHVLRCFEDENISHVHGKIDPVYDAEIVEMELILKDLESVEKQLGNLEKRLKSGDKTVKDQVELLQEIREPLTKGIAVRSMVNQHNSDAINQLQLLTSKPLLYVGNVWEQEAVTGNDFTALIDNKAGKEGAGQVIISSKIEEEIANLDNAEDKTEFLNALGLTETGLGKIIRASYKLLNLHSFFTIGPKEAHAWTFPAGISAPQAAGIIHTDFERGFIRAEIISYEDYKNCGSELKARELGKARLEGKEYKMQDGDIVHFRFNV